MGCAVDSSWGVPVYAGVPVQLEEGQGLLVVQIDSDVPVEDARLGSRVLVERLPPGRHLWLVTMPAGRYEWTTVAFASEAGQADRIRLRNLGLRFDDEFSFDVVAGHLNYPGELIIRSHPFYRSVGGYWIRSRNHSAMAVRELRQTHAAIVDAFPIRYGGRSGDDFLEFYTRVRDQQAERVSERRP